MKGYILMDKTHSPAFRTSIGGFNKTDVNAYIAKLSLDFDERTSALEAEVERLKAELDKSSALLKAASERTEADKAVNDTAAGLRIELERANSIIASQTEQIDVSKEELERVSSELLAASEKLAKYADCENKLAKYEEASARMGEIYMEATVDADRIRSEAKAAADRLINETKAQCRGYVDEVENALISFAAAQKSAVSDLFEVTQNSIADILADFDKKSRALAEESKSFPLSSFANKDTETAE